MTNYLIAAKVPPEPEWYNVLTAGANQLDPTGTDDCKAKIESLLAAHDALYFPKNGASPGLYKVSSRITIPSGKAIKGDGIANSRIIGTFGFGANNTIGWYTRGNGICIGRPDAASTHLFVDGAHDVKLFHVRFRSYGTLRLWDMGDYVAWSESPKASPNRKCNVVDVLFDSCQFEFPGNNTSGGMFEMWWDVRPGGGVCDGFEWRDCVWGVRNKDGDYSGWDESEESYTESNCVQCLLLVQPAPPEHGTGGPRPGSSIEYGFDWAGKVGDGHGIGLGCGRANPKGFKITRGYFLGRCHLAAIDICCNTRSYYYTTAKDGGGEWLYTPAYISANPNCSEAERLAMPDKYGTNRGWYLEDVWIGDDFRPEIGPRDNPQFDANGARVYSGGSPYNYPDHKGDTAETIRYYVPKEVEDDDLALYPGLTPRRVES